MGPGSSAEFIPISRDHAEDRERIHTLLLKRHCQPG